MSRRIWLIYFVPFIALIIWQVVILLGSSTTDPQWVVSAEGQAFGQCDDAINIDGFDADTDVRLNDASIDSSDSYDTARDVISENPQFSYSGLAEVSLPDDDRRLVWAHVFVLDDGGAQLMGPTEVVYVDANTGKPLVLVTDVVIGDPFFGGCQQQFAAAIDDFFDRWQPLVYLVVYALAMLGALGFVSLLNRIRARRARKTEVT